MSSPNIEPELALRFSIFTNPDSHLEWKNYIQYAREQRQFPPDITARWIDALSFLSRELGDNFLSQINHYHPLFDLIAGMAPWQVERIIQYTEILQYLATEDPDYKAFLKKLKAPVSAKTEAMDFLMTAQMLHSVGLRVRFPKPIPIQKNPDIFIIDPATQETLYAEVSRMGESENRINCNRSYTKLKSIIDYYLSDRLYSAELIQHTPIEYKGTLSCALRQLQKEVTEHNVWAHYEDDYFTINIFPLSQEKAFNTWLEKENRRKGFIGPPLNFDDTSRISGYKIREEAKQIPPDRTGLIIIPVNFLHFWQQRTTEAIRSFQYRLKNRPNIVGVYLFSEILNHDASVLTFSPDERLAAKQIKCPLNRYSLFVQNEAYDGSLHPVTLKKLICALQ